MLNYYCANIDLLEEENVFEECFLSVNEQRKEKISRCKNKEDKKRSLMAGVLLQRALQREHIECYYSISHSEKYAGVIVSDRPVGVDIEFSGRTVLGDGREKSLETIARKCLAPAEWEQFSKSDRQEKKRLFLEYWTKKESYSKAVGKGLQMDFSTIDTETEKEKYFSTWTTDGYCVSFYVQDGNYTDLKIEKIKNVN